MLRFLRYRSLKLARRYPRGSGGLIARLIHSRMLQWNSGTVPRGIAIGMFWTFVPIPLQTLPAALFCVMLRGYLPAALLCVWLTNPITLPPVLLLEYRLGEWIVGMFPADPGQPGISEAKSAFGVFAGSLRLILIGSLPLSCAAMAVSYAVIWLMFRSNREQRRLEIMERRRRRGFGGPAEPAKPRSRAKACGKP